MILQSAAVGPFFKNGYVVGCERTRQAVFIDPGDEVEQLLERCEASGYRSYDHPVSAQFLEDVGLIIALLYTPRGEGIMSTFDRRYSTYDDDESRNA